MKTERKILIAFILNLAFSVFELIGSFLTGSVAIMSDAIHDLGDAASIGCSYFLESKSTQQPDERYTYGYGRFSVMGSCITTAILIVGSVMVVYNSIIRILHPVDINYSRMIIFAVVGVLVNFGAAFFTRDGNSLNQKAVNLHMLEDVLGWCVVLVGAIVMHFTDFALLDPIMSICVSAFILISALENMKAVLVVLLERVPLDINLVDVTEGILNIDGVLDVHHIHIWSLDGQRNFATLHVVSDSDPLKIKQNIRKVMEESGISHVTIELEASADDCQAKVCKVEEQLAKNHCHHHHHHKHHKSHQHSH